MSTAESQEIRRRILQGRFDLCTIAELFEESELLHRNKMGSVIGVTAWIEGSESLAASTSSVRSWKGPLEQIEQNLHRFATGKHFVGFSGRTMVCMVGEGLPQISPSSFLPLFSAAVTNRVACHDARRLSAGRVTS